MAKIRKHKSSRNGKPVTVREHDREEGKSRQINSSFLERIGEEPEGGYYITIGGRKYPYPGLPNSRVGGILRGTNGSSGRYYNKHIRGRYF